MRRRRGRARRPTEVEVATRRSTCCSSATRSRRGGDASAQPRSSLERHAKATVIESYVGARRRALLHERRHRGRASATARRSTHLQDSAGERSARSTSARSTCARRATATTSRSRSRRARRCRARTSTRTLDGEGCGATLNGLYMVDGEQHVRPSDAHRARRSRTATAASSTRASSTARRTACSTARCTCIPIAQKTDGKQTNNTLLLSEKAQIDTKPQLEIFADDVKCTHGATVGRLDETALFYMKSRGIARRRSARQLLTYAFAADVLETIELGARFATGWRRLTLRRATCEPEALRALGLASALSAPDLAMDLNASTSRSSSTTTGGRETFGELDGGEPARRGAQSAAAATR